MRQACASQGPGVRNRPSFAMPAARRERRELALGTGRCYYHGHAALVERSGTGRLCCPALTVTLNRCHIQPMILFNASPTASGNPCAMPGATRVPVFSRITPKNRPPTNAESAQPQESDENPIAGS
jgi:hypothetical protein